MALQGGGDSTRRGSEASVNTNDPHHHHQQPRRRGGSGDENRRRDSTTTNGGSLEFCEPAQPRGSSPVSRPPSARQRQGELNVSQSRGVGRGGSDTTSYEAQPFDSRESTAGRTASGGRAAAPGQRDSVAGASIGSRGGLGGGRAVSQASVPAAGGDIVGSTNTAGAYRRTLAESSTRRGSSSAIGGNNRGSTNNQAADTIPSGSTPQRLSSSSGRATSCPSGSPYQEAGFHRADGGSSEHNDLRGGRRIQRRGEHDDRTNDSAYSRRPSCGDGGGSGKHRDSSQHEQRGQGDGGGGAQARASPSTAPSGPASTQLDRRLPSIDGLNINSPADNCSGDGRVGSQGDEESVAPSSSSSLMRQRRAKDPPGNSGGRYSSLTAADQCLPGQGILGDEASGQNCSNNNDDRREDGGKEHACVGVLGSSGDSRLDHPGYNNSGGLAAPSGSNSGGEIALQARRIGSSGSGGGGRTRNNGEVAGRSNDAGSNNKNSHKSNNARNNSSSSSGTSRACLVGLQNLGNTCFMNACLQCLLHTDALVDLFRRRLHHEQRLSSHNNKSPTRGALVEAFRELVVLVEASPAHSNVSPAQVRNLCWNSSAGVCEAVRSSPQGSSNLVEVCVKQVQASGPRTICFPDGMPFSRVHY